ncbi:hypothetical protein SISSUDRAFT_1059516 [Sistotremastrum suecicum HHB10207 ss-3]|uniref:Uncharacterized protein n=1 Tax=Sistotremastrum suecicum HHB10207 ss-3 TaxID=1314776 RepID=A0A166G791_9AGAM|nr:hypothetical protein SISSUDRAFT_1059516 [Sistotremastrum suecicum HHB10207 ss-3]
MSQRRKNGAFVAAATTEAARRQLMMPVPCWELQLVTPEGVNPSSGLKILKWVQTDKKQHFSDSEDEADDALAPLPDLPEGGEVEGDDDDQEDDPAQSASRLESRDVSEPIIAPSVEPPTQPPSPKPHPLSVSLVPEPDDETPDNEVGQDLTLDTFPLGPPVGDTDTLDSELNEEAMEDVLGMDAANAFADVDDPLVGAGDENDVLSGMVDEELLSFEPPEQ